MRIACAFCCLVGLVACGSRSALPDFDKVDRTDAEPDAGKHDPPPLPPGCFDAGETLLATGEIAPTAIAVDATHVYWASAGIECADGRIRRMPKAGGPIETLADEQANPRAIAVDQARVYFFNGCGSGLLRSVPKSGGAIFNHPISIDPFHDARVLALDSQNIYFNDYGVLRVPKSGGPQSEIDNHDYVYGLAADDAGVHWIGPIGGGPSYGVFGYQLGDPAPTLLAQPDYVNGGIALDRDSIYFAGGSGILQIPRAGGALTPLVAGTPNDIALDDSHVYWSEGFSGSGGHSIKKVSKTGGSETVLTTGDGAYLELAVDERCVYWADLYGHRIGRMPK